MWNFYPLPSYPISSWPLVPVAIQEREATTLLPRPKPLDTVPHLFPPTQAEPKAACTFVSWLLTKQETLRPSAEEARALPEPRLPKGPVKEPVWGDRGSYEDSIWVRPVKAHQGLLGSIGVPLTLVGTRPPYKGGSFGV